MHKAVNRWTVILTGWQLRDGKPLRKTENEMER